MESALRLRYTLGMPDVHAILRERLRQAIDRSGRKQYEICAEADVDPGHLSKLLLGRSKMDLEKLVRLAAALGVDVAWLLGEETAAEGLAPWRKVPVLLQRRWPNDVPRDSLMETIIRIAHAEAVAQTRDPMAFGIQLESATEDLAVGEVAIVSPAVPLSEGDRCAAILDGALVIGRHHLLDGKHRLYYARAFRDDAQFIGLIIGGYRSFLAPVLS